MGPSQNWRSFVFDHAKWFVPVLMCTVLCVQLAAVWLFDMSRWKGAGMGMFSEISDRKVIVVSNDVREGFQIDIPGSLDKNRKALETLPIDHFSDRLWEKLQNTVYFRADPITGAWKQADRPYLQFGDRISYEEADELNTLIGIWHHAYETFTPLKSANISVYSVDTYKPTAGTVTLRKIFEKTYPVRE